MIFELYDKHILFLRTAYIFFISLNKGWGMSELSPIGTFTSDYNIKSGSVGPLVSNTLGKIIDTKTGKSLPPNHPGELLIKVTK